MQHAKQTAVHRTTRPAATLAAQAASRAAELVMTRLAATTVKRSLDLALGSVLLVLAAPALAARSARPRTQGGAATRQAY